jgi:hypothetical protein
MDRHVINLRRAGKRPRLATDPSDRWASHMERVQHDMARVTRGHRAGRTGDWQRGLAVVRALTERSVRAAGTTGARGMLAAIKRVRAGD